MPDIFKKNDGLGVVIRRCYAYASQGCQQHLTTVIWQHMAAVVFEHQGRSVPASLGSAFEQDVPLSLHRHCCSSLCNSQGHHAISS